MLRLLLSKAVKALDVPCGPARASSLEVLSSAFVDHSYLVSSEELKIAHVR